MTPEQKEAARARMAKAREVRMAKYRGTAVIDQVERPVIDVRGFDIVLAFRITRDGPFHGLWQLYKQVNGQFVPIGAETSKLSVLNLARQEVASYLP